MKAFSSALSNGSLKALRILFLHTNMIGDIGMNAFTEACGNLGDLTILDLGTNLITDDGMAKFLSAINLLTKLVLIWCCLFSVNYISDATQKLAT
jgi:hypothetical protein